MNINKIHFLLLTLLCVMSAKAQNLRIGDLYTAPDGSQGVVYYVQPNGVGWMVALHDASEGCAWGNTTDVQGLNNYNNATTQQLFIDTAGYSNTQVLRNYQNDNGYAAGVVDFPHGWMLPTCSQLRTLFAQLPFISYYITSNGGDDLAYGSYWSSTERDNQYAWSVSFESGDVSYLTKTTYCRVRAIRRFTYTEDAGLIYAWSTGNSTSSIVVTPTQTTAYTVTVTSLGGCEDSVTETITVLSYDTMHIQFTDDTICAGDSVTLFVTATDVVSVPSVTVGDILCTDATIVKLTDFASSGKTAYGVVFYVDNTAEHGWAIHLQNQGTALWGGYGTDIQTLPNYLTAREAIADIDGYGNTQKIRAAGNASAYPAAYLVDFAQGWYLPAIGQLCELWAVSAIVNGTLESVGGTPLQINSFAYYKSSTEYNQNSAWSLMNGGDISTSVKNYTFNSHFVRSIRTF